MPSAWMAPAVIVAMRSPKVLSAFCAKMPRMPSRLMAPLPMPLNLVLRLLPLRLHPLLLHHHHLSVILLRALALHTLQLLPLPPPVIIQTRLVRHTSLR